MKDNIIEGLKQQLQASQKETSGLKEDIHQVGKKA